MIARIHMASGGYTGSAEPARASRVNNIIVVINTPPEASRGLNKIRDRILG
jgi:hypothetical protein